ncbi:hypothetical protein K439DRAFT_955755 [Ramaria rubella]|nr:hypothetical protein K439DRAFT_955755 [Ramaria rubella]
MPLRQKRDCACESPAEQKTELIVAISVLFSVLALFTYDYVLNFSREVKLMWKRPWQYPTAFYFLSRYLPFVGMVYDVAMIPVTSQLVSGGSEVSLDILRRSTITQPLEQQSCTDIYHFIDATRFLVNMILIAVLIVQTYAIYNHNRLILFLLGCLAVASLVGTGFRSAIRTCSLDPPDNRPFHQYFFNRSNHVSYPCLGFNVVENCRNHSFFACAVFLYWICSTHYSFFLHQRHITWPHLPT